jgi:hypothetical protein
MEGSRLRRWQMMQEQALMGAETPRGPAPARSLASVARILQLSASGFELPVRGAGPNRTDE